MTINFWFTKDHLHIYGIVDVFQYIFFFNETSWKIERRASHYYPRSASVTIVIDFKLYFRFFQDKTLKNVLKHIVFFPVFCFDNTIWLLVISIQLWNKVIWQNRCFRYVESAFRKKKLFFLRLGNDFTKNSRVFQSKTRTKMEHLRLWVM